jgi:hypothetical protein
MVATRVARRAKPFPRGRHQYYTDPEKELDHAFYKKRLPLTIQMLQEVGIIYAQNVQKNVKNICAR